MGSEPDIRSIIMEIIPRYRRSLRPLLIRIPGRFERNNFSSRLLLSRSDHVQDEWISVFGIVYGGFNSRRSLERTYLVRVKVAGESTFKISRHLTQCLQETFVG